MTPLLRLSGLCSLPRYVARWRADELARGEPFGIGHITGQLGHHDDLFSRLQNGGCPCSSSTLSVRTPSIAFGSSWLGEPIEKYADWLSEQGYLTKTVASRVPLLIRFGEFAWERGAREWVGLPAHLDAFIEHQTHARAETLTAERRRCYQNELRGPIEQMLRLLVPGFVGRGRGRKSDPFHDRAAGFFRYLYEERGLREASVTQYRHELRAFEAYLDRIQLQSLQELSPTVLSAYVIDRSPRLSRSSIIGFCCALRVFLRYLHRQGFVPEDLSRTVETPRAYRLSSIPRSISWGEVGRMLEAVDRRSAVGRRDYAILLLLVTYGLRAREVAALTLDDIEWRRERLRVPERKAGHSTAYPLSPIVGQAILQYLRQGPDSPLMKESIQEAQGSRRHMQLQDVRKVLPRRSDPAGYKRGR